jgi:hypothetical protein
MYTVVSGGTSTQREKGTHAPPLESLGPPSCAATKENAKPASPITESTRIAV